MKEQVKTKIRWSCDRCNYGGIVESDDEWVALSLVIKAHRDTTRDCSRGFTGLRMKPLSGRLVGDRR